MWASDRERVWEACSVRLSSFWFFFPLCEAIKRLLFYIRLTVSYFKRWKPTTSRFFLSPQCAVVPPKKGLNVYLKTACHCSFSSIRKNHITTWKYLCLRKPSIRPLFCLEQGHQEQNTSTEHDQNQQEWLRLAGYTMKAAATVGSRWAANQFVNNSWCLTLGSADLPPELWMSLTSWPVLTTVTVS